MFGAAKKQPRLLQWDGRTRSSRHETPLLNRLGERSVLVRMGLVLVTTLAVTLLAWYLGPPLPHRVGEIYPYDLRARVDFEILNLLEFVNNSEPPTEPDAPDVKIREQAQYASRPVVEKYPRDLVLAPRGTPLQKRQLDLLHEEHRAYQKSLTPADHWARGIALFLIFSLLATVVVLYVSRFQTGLAHSTSSIVGVGLLVLATLALGLFLSQPPWHAVGLPLTMTVMILTLVYNPQFALVMTVSLALTLTVALGMTIEQFLQLMGGLTAAVLLLRNVRTRTQLIQVSACAGLAYSSMTVATEVLTGQTIALIVADSLRNFVAATLAGFLLTGLLPLIERVFGVVTDISLLELADGSHPLLQELVRRAPGTYTHSITVATLGEAAAESIGANPLLVRVGCYFHDIGKMLKPHYFIENQTGENRHDVLEPALSTLVIIGHVKDGLALASQYRLPRPIVDFIAQHHGTTLVEYFYREACKLQGNGGGSSELEANFRYPGPKPQSRENGIVMLADAVESTSRALVNPTPSSLGKLVHDLLMKRLLDGQFEESGLTLTELHRIEESLCKSLIALFHARIKYPDEVPLGKAS